ncbi:phage baseplate protein [Psychrobacter urativorans]|uniref:Baseplate structural protein Gp10 C-terminal domain-containing protein n=1 Tax=Psychrobacter urativorans TaxID=45610 RepID=A0A0M3V948_9GAMM|nr:hypothetical protein [Psychrobacter urativorans]ALF60323.1 hypothetical protein AOC03_09965 [Psychrobacter urativorans]
MSTLALTPQWHDAINQVETTEKILGGAAGNANLASKQLAENILWLKQTIENIRNEPIKVGDIYTTTISHATAAAVNTHHGYGTWERFAEGRTLVGYSTKSTDIAEYKTMGNEFGENTHKLTVDEMPSHRHTLKHGRDNGITDNDAGTIASDTPIWSNQYIPDSTIGSAGGDQPHNNTQPSKVVANWLRTA